MIITSETMSALNALLNLPATGHEQDWAIELADKSRLAEFLKFIENESLSPQYKHAMMELILASYDDYLLDRQDEQDKMWLEIKQVLDRDRTMYFDLLHYWSLADRKSDDTGFNITPLVRNYLRQNILTKEQVELVNDARKQVKENPGSFLDWDDARGR